MKYYQSYDNKDCSCTNGERDELYYKVINENAINDSLKYHVDNNLFVTENIYRYGSEEFFNFINDVRELYENNDIELSSLNESIIKTDIGKRGIYNGEEVWLDIPNEEVEIESLTEAEYKGKKVELNKPKRGGTKKFYVYTKNDKGNVIKVSFGAKSGGGKLAVKLKDPKARSAFAKRHNCEQKNDKTKPSYWSCRLPRYAKSLGLSGGGKWW
jgi:hypothetical protein